MISSIRAGALARAPQQEVLNLAPKEKICLYCGKTFIPKNSKGYFCKTSHRVGFYKRKKRRQRQQEIKAIAEKMREEALALRLQREEAWHRELREMQEKEIAEIRRLIKS